jgi:hypothetical protein
LRPEAGNGRLTADVLSPMRDARLPTPGFSCAVWRCGAAFMHSKEMTTARIILASARRPYQRLFAILSGHTIRFVTTLDDAQDALAGDPFDLVMIGTYFDESRMFDLLRQVRADERYANVPVICFRGVLQAGSHFNREDVEVACRSIGATAFFDLAEFPDDAAGNAAVRKIISEVMRVA